MVFSSYVFIFGFLPLVLIGFWLISRISREGSRLWLCAASLVFYGWWEVRWIPVLLLSIVFNFGMGWLLINRASQTKWTSPILLGAIAANLLALAYYKYLGAIIGFLEPGSHWVTGLPLGISFFTFTQIAFLVDVSQGFKERYSFINYLLFVTFFPHLIAGPIVHHRDLMPQFEDRRNYRFQPQEFAVGLAIFTIGLAKKAIIADALGARAEQLLQFHHPHQIVAVVAVLCYSMQLYFDFSGYSDMAIGLARMFGIKFPANFASPYKATSIIDFWQRWHITLTRFLTAYIYNPLAVALVRRRAMRGLSSSARVSRTWRGFAELIAFPTMVTMVLAGIWHGAGLQYVVFGALHGFYIATNHAWRTFGPKNKPESQNVAAIERIGYGVLVYLCVVMAQIFFHAPSVGSAIATVSDVSGFHAVTNPVPWPHGFFHFGHAVGDDRIPMIYSRDMLTLLLAMILVWFAPNTQQLMSRFEPALNLTDQDKISRFRITFHRSWGFAIGMLLFVSLSNVSDDAPFIYFQF